MPSADLDRRPEFWEWMGAQHLNSERLRAEAAKHIRSRWPFNPGYSHARVLRSLENENSPHLEGAQGLADDYASIFGLNPLEQVQISGSLGPLMPIEVTRCSNRDKGKQCIHRSIPGSDLCDKHGGMWLTEAERRAIVVAVQDRLVTVADRAHRVLVEMLDSCKSEKVRADVAFGLLDRIGVGPTSKVDLTVTASAADQAAEVRKRLDSMRERLEGLARADSEVVSDGGASAEGDIVIAEVVEG